MSAVNDKIDWAKIDPFLGELTTLELAEKFSVTIGRVAYRRKILGITAVKRRRRASGYIQKLESEGRELPKKCTNPVSTPFGVYLPDFEYEDRFIEIKSDYTFDVCIGKKWYGTSKPSRPVQMEKINYIREYIKPVQVIIINKKSHGKFAQFI